MTDPMNGQPICRWCGETPPFEVKSPHWTCQACGRRQDIMECPICGRVAEVERAEAVLGHPVGVQRGPKPSMADDLTALLRRVLAEYPRRQRVSVDVWAQSTAARLAEVVDGYVIESVMAEIKEVKAGAARTHDRLALEALEHEETKGERDAARKAHLRDLDLMRDDVGKLGEALGHPDVARPVSPHEVMVQFTAEVAEAVALLRELVECPHPSSDYTRAFQKARAYLARRKEAT